MFNQYQNFKRKMKHQAVSGYDLSLSKVTSRKIFVPSDLAPDISDGLDPVQGIAQVFSEPSNIDLHTSLLITQMKFVTPLSCDLKTGIIKPTSRNIFVSADMAPDLLFGIYSGRVITRVLFESFILNSYFHDF